MGKGIKRHWLGLLAFALLVGGAGSAGAEDPIDLGRPIILVDGTTVTTTGGADGVGIDEVLEEGAGLTKRAQVNFIGASITCVDDAGNTRINCTVADASPGGADKQVQFNDGGAFAGDADLTWDKTANDLGVGDCAFTTPAANVISITCNGIEVLRANSAASGANHFDFTPSAAGTPITLAAAGTDTNLGLILASKGGGQLQFKQGGNLRVNIADAVVLQNDVLIRRDVNAGLTASTTQTQGQGALTAEYNEVSTVANANDTVTLPAAVAGLKIVVINNGANTMQIFPASGDDLGAGVDTATTLGSALKRTFHGYDATNWGTGISVSSLEVLGLADFTGSVSLPDGAVGALSSIADLCAAGEGIFRNSGDTGWECKPRNDGFTATTHSMDAREEVTAPLDTRKAFHLIVTDPDPAGVNFVIRLPPFTGTMTQIDCEVYGGTNVIIDVCDGEDFADDTCTTSIPGATMPCDTTGVTDNSLSATGFAARDKVSIVLLSESGSVDRLEIYGTATVD